MAAARQFSALILRGKAMVWRVLIGVASFVIATASLTFVPARADVIVLKTGGEIRGELLGDARTSAKTEQLSIRTLTGGIVTVSRGDIESVTRRRLVVEEYETQRRALADTVDAHWNLAEWCRERSLAKERETHLARITELDPEHVKAHRALGHIQHEGRWTTRDEMMAARGYVKHKGKYLLPQELELLAQEQRETEEEKAWYKKIRMWRGWVESGGERHADGLAQLKSISDRDAIPALVRNFAEDANEQFRLLYVSILSQIRDEQSISPLVVQSLKDESRFVREAAIQGVLRIDRFKAMPAYVRALKNDLNVVVNRAGTALGQIGDESIIPELIESLVTSHRYRFMVPDQNQIGFRTDGTMAPSSGTVPLPPDIYALLATGQLPQGVQVVQPQLPGQELRMKPALVRKDEQNPSVLNSLQLLTGQDFGYNESAWRTWFATQKTGTISKRKSKA